ncbi:hypothetical protein E2I00_014722 [Balaenoptera physalus]|uniref:Uncharacterized protein n=1 Tax=Balaenoptera physalus TaxID=9770 RepID=A0A6A1Q903_BALPH|nr:hypothetical protein E2I00_014722 [Balaenoptera physalus]
MSSKHPTLNLVVRIPM